MTADGSISPISRALLCKYWLINNTSVDSKDKYL